MADVKISALTGATTPLAGTEVLPIVQSGTTKKVSIDNLTAGRAISATSVTASTGNFVVGTSGQGVDFSATPGTGTSELFSDYEEGTWTPVCNPNGGTITTQTCSGTYTKVGRLVTVQMSIVVDNAGTAPSLASITGLPFTSANTNSVGSGCLREFNAVGATWNFTVSPNTNEMFPARYDNTNAIISGFAWRGSVSYFV